MKRLTAEWVAKAEADYQGAVKFRYPGLSATAAQARSAMHSLRTVRRRVRKRLGL